MLAGSVFEDKRIGINRIGYDTKQRFYSNLWYVEYFNHKPQDWIEVTL